MVEGARPGPSPRYRAYDSRAASSRRGRSSNGARRRRGRASRRTALTRRRGADGLFAEGLSAASSRRVEYGFGRRRSDRGAASRRIPPSTTGRRQGPRRGASVLRASGVLPLHDRLLPAAEIDAVAVSRAGERGGAPPPRCALAALDLALARATRRTRSQRAPRAIDTELADYRAEAPAAIPLPRSRAPTPQITGIAWTRRSRTSASRGLAGRRSGAPLARGSSRVADLVDRRRRAGEHVDHRRRSTDHLKEREIERAVERREQRR